MRRIGVVGICVLALTCTQAPVALAANGTASSISTVAENKANDADRVLVRWIGLRDYRQVVRASALKAWTTEDDGTAIRDWLDNGYDFIKAYAAKLAQRNKDFCARVLATYTTEYSPEVHAAAERALRGSDTDRQSFVDHGFADAKAADQQTRDLSGEQEKALAEFDREFVRTVAKSDPGTRVRAAADYATRPAATTSDLVEFFASGWASAARQDMDAYRADLADADVAWHAKLATLFVAAQQAEQAARDAAAAAKERAKSEALTAWNAVNTLSDKANSTWDVASRTAEEQAATWQKIAEAANTQQGPNWSALDGPAKNNLDGWSAEQSFARDQARYWSDLLAQARAGEDRVTHL